MIANTNTPKLLLTRREAAGALSLSERTLFDLTKQGVIPSVRFGERCVRYSVEAIEKAIAANRDYPQPGFETDHLPRTNR